MADDGDSGGGILGDIADAAGDVGGAIADEFKKLGSSATSQVTGSAPTQTSNNSQSTDDVSILDQLIGTNGKNNSKVHDSAGDEVKKFGQSFLSQITGHEVAHEQLAKEDDEFSKRESDAIAAKIKQIYAQHVAKRQQQEKQEEMVEEKQEEQKKDFEQVRKKEEVRSDIQKTRAEIKNYGAE